MAKRTVAFERRLFDASEAAKQLMKRGVVVTDMRVNDSGTPVIKVLPPKHGQLDELTNTVIGCSDGHREEIKSARFQRCLVMWQTVKSEVEYARSH